MSSTANQRLTPQEYLAIERAAEFKSEFFAGEMFAMAGATAAHVLITSNVTGELSLQLKNRPSRVYASNLRVKVSATGLYTYPDVIVAYGELQFDDEQNDTLLNPTLIVEVLAPSTESWDRGDKFAHYRRLESLQEYVLISQHRPWVEWYLRQPDDRGWLLTEVKGLQGSVSLSSISCELAMAEIYHKVELPPDAPPLRRRQT
jgi:Uma2 family endonuclease